MARTLKHIPNADFLDESEDLLKNLSESDGEAVGFVGEDPISSDGEPNTDDRDFVKNALSIEDEDPAVYAAFDNKRKRLRRLSIAKATVNASKKRKHLSIGLPKDINKEPLLKKKRSNSNSIVIDLISDEESEDERRARNVPNPSLRLRPISTPPLPTQSPEAQRFSLSQLMNEDEDAMDIDIVPPTPPFVMPVPVDEEAERVAAGLETIALPKDNRNPRFHGIHMALEMSNCEITPITFANRILSAWKKDIIRVAIVAETGKEGEHKHTHGYVEFKRKVSLTFMEIRKVMAIPDAKGNPERALCIQSVRSLSRYKIYLDKEQGDDDIWAPKAALLADGSTFDWNLWISIAVMENKKSYTEMAEYVCTNKGKVDWQYMYEKWNPFIVERSRKHLENMARVIQDASNSPKLPWVPLPLVANATHNVIYDKINSWMENKDKVETDGRRAQLALKGNCFCIVGDPNMRKTSLMKHVFKSVSSYAYVDASNSNFPLAMATTDDPDIILIEASRGMEEGGISAALLEKLIDMDPGQIFNVKGATWKPKRRVLFVILTNVAPKFWWNKQVMNAENQLVREGLNEALRARIRVHHVTQFFTGFEDPEKGAINLNKNDEGVYNNEDF